MKNESANPEERRSVRRARRLAQTRRGRSVARLSRELNEILSLPILELPWSVRIANFLENAAGVRYVGELVQIDDAKLSRELRRFGSPKKVRKEIEETLADAGVGLGMHVRQWRPQELRSIAVNDAAEAPKAIPMAIVEREPPSSGADTSDVKPIPDRLPEEPFTLDRRALFRAAAEFRDWMKPLWPVLMGRARQPGVTRGRWRDVEQMSLEKQYLVSLALDCAAATDRLEIVNGVMTWHARALAGQFLSWPMSVDRSRPFRPTVAVRLHLVATVGAVDALLMDEPAGPLATRVVDSAIKKAVTPKKGALGMVIGDDVGMFVRLGPRFRPQMRVRCQRSQMREAVDKWAADRQPFARRSEPEDGTGEKNAAESSARAT